LEVLVGSHPPRYVAAFNLSSPNSTHSPIFAGLKHNATKIKSVEGVDIAWLEEGDRISRESLDILIPTIRKPRSEIWITFNPNEPTDPVYQDFVIADPPRTNAIVRKVNYVKNPFFPEVLREVSITE